MNMSYKKCGLNGRTSLMHTPHTAVRFRPAVYRLNLAAIAAFIGLMFAGASIVTGQESAGAPAAEEVPGCKLLTPSSYGFDLEVARPEASPWEAVATRDESGEETVARVHVKVGDDYIVMLPNGQLVARRAADVAPTDQKFSPASAEEIAAEIIRGPWANFKYRKSKHYVFIYNTTEAFADVTRTILESMFNGVEGHVKNMGIDVESPSVPLVVLMFNREAQFQAFRTMPPGVVAYYNMVSNHVVLHEESRLAGARPDLARGQLLSTIAHEGAHQILHNIGVQQRLSLWPMWLSEGIAEYFAPTSFGKRFRWKGAGVINDLRMFELETYLQSKVIEGFNGDTISKVVAARQLNSTGYATAWAITHFLAKKRKRDFADYVRLVSRLGPLQGMASHGDSIPENLEHFASFFTDDVVEMEREMVDYLTRQKYTSPVIDYIHYVGMVEFPVDGKPKRHACFFHTREKVEQWREVVLSHLDRGQRDQAVWDIKQFPNRADASRFIRRFIN